jgi:high-affinity nickel-transport protein
VFRRRVLGSAWSSADRAAVVGTAAFVLLLHLIGWGVLIGIVVPAGYRLGDSGAFGVGLGVTAYLLGVRHAFDADHIAAIDNTTRKLVGDGKQALTTGFWFSLGHSSVVFGLSVLLAAGVTVFTDPLQDDSSSLHHSLGLFGGLVAGTFLIIIGLMNLSALVGIVHVYRHLRLGTFDEEALEHHLHNRGILARLFRRVTQRVSSPRQLYLVGLLIGLGFDTATQVALLVLAGGTSAMALPWYAILVLPVLFAAGMTLFDTVDGIVMARTYQWAFINPARKLFYNFTVTVLSVAVALGIGTIVLLQLAADELDFSALTWVTRVDLKYVGAAVFTLFLVIWLASIPAFRRIDLRSEG